MVLERTGAANDTVVCGRITSGVEELVVVITCSSPVVLPEEDEEEEEEKKVEIVEETKFDGVKVGIVVELIELVVSFEENWLVGIINKEAVDVTLIDDETSDDTIGVSVLDTNCEVEEMSLGVETGVELINWVSVYVLVSSDAL